MGDPSPCLETTPDIWATKRQEFESKMNSYTLQLSSTSDAIKANATQNLQNLLVSVNNYINNACTTVKTNQLVSAQIVRLEEENESLKTDVESALARDELLRSRESNISSHKLFLLDRPIRRNMIPYLWILSIMFIGVGLIIFKVMAPIIQTPSATYIGIWLASFVSDKFVLYSVLGAALIVILFLSLKIAGVFGK